MSWPDETCHHSSDSDSELSSPTLSSCSLPSSLSSNEMCSSDDCSVHCIDHISSLERSFCSNFVCCNQRLSDLHELLDHFEESHVIVISSDGTPIYPRSSASLHISRRSSSTSPATAISSPSETPSPVPNQTSESATYKTQPTSLRSRKPNPPLIITYPFPPTPPLPTQPLYATENLYDSDFAMRSPSPNILPITPTQAPYDYEYEYISASMPSYSHAPSVSPATPSRPHSASPSSTSSSDFELRTPPQQYSPYLGSTTDMMVDLDTEPKTIMPTLLSPLTRVFPAGRSRGVPATVSGGPERIDKRARGLRKGATTRVANADGRTDEMDLSGESNDDVSSPGGGKSSGRRRGVKRERTFKCPTNGCTKSYLNPNGLKYHLEKGTCVIEKSSESETSQQSSRGALPTPASDTPNLASNLPPYAFPTITSPVSYITNANDTSPSSESFVAPSASASPVLPIPSPSTVGPFSSMTLPPLVPLGTAPDDAMEGISYPVLMSAPSGMQHQCFN